MSGRARMSTWASPSVSASTYQRATPSVVATAAMQNVTTGVAMPSFIPLSMFSTRRTRIGSRSSATLTRIVLRARIPRITFLDFSEFVARRALGRT